VTFRNWMLAGLVLASAAANVAHAATAQPGVMLDRSEIGFISKQMNVPVEGKFKRFTANVVFDPARLDASRAELSIDMDSIDLGSPMAETEVKRKGWFDTANNPRAKFVSTGIKNLGPGKFEVTGKLTIKGTTRDIVIPFTMQSAGAAGTIAEGRFVMKRLDYKIGDGPWADVGVVADEVEVRIKMALAGKQGGR
jgi:polyisoprenoid-binding protein YceI